MVVPFMNEVRLVPYVKLLIVDKVIGGSRFTTSNEIVTFDDK